MFPVFISMLTLKIRFGVKRWFGHLHAGLIHLNPRFHKVPG